METGDKPVFLWYNRYNEKGIKKRGIFMTIHKMNLDDQPFLHIKNGTKTIELRLYDEKRRRIQVNDLIEFTNRQTNEKIMVLVEDLYRYSNFGELYKHFDKIALGYEKEEQASPKNIIRKKNRKSMA